MKKFLISFLLATLIMIPTEFYAEEMIPHSFSAGDTISADMMNEIFQKIKNVTEGFSSGADIVGTWSCTRSSIESNCSSSSIYSADSNGISYTASGTLSLVNDGDGTYSWTSSINLQGQCNASDHANTQTRDYDIIQGNMLVLSANTTTRNAGSSSKSGVNITKMSPNKLSLIHI